MYWSIIKKKLPENHINVYRASEVGSTCLLCSFNLAVWNSFTLWGTYYIIIIYYILLVLNPRLSYKK